MNLNDSMDGPKKQWTLHQGTLLAGLGPVMYLSHLYLQVMYVFSFLFMSISDNKIREFQLETLLTLHQHSLQVGRVHPDSAAYLNGMFQAITMPHMSLISRCRLTISQHISLILEHMISVLSLRRTPIS